MAPIPTKQWLKVHRLNEIKAAIVNNEPIEEFLHVIMVISNPIGFERRWKLGVEFRDRMMRERNVKLYIVEVAYGNQQFRVTNQYNKNHLQIRTNSAPLWIKENMINIGVKKLLPNDWKAFAFIDSDIEFEDPHWALNTLKILNGGKDVVQIFSHCMDMGPDELAMNVSSSFAFHYNKNESYQGSGNVNYWHSGYGMALTRKAYDQLGGIYEKAILGSGDFNMCMCLIQNGIKSINDKYHHNYIQSILDFQDRCANLRLGYTPVVIRHYYHGSKIRRAYHERWKILVEHQFDPEEHITTDENGLIVPTTKCPQGLLDDIYKYFESRQEDDI